MNTFTSISNETELDARLDIGVGHVRWWQSDSCASGVLVAVKCMRDTISILPDNSNAGRGQMDTGCTGVNSFVSVGW